MTVKVLNTKSKPEVYFGLHMVEGLAEYAEPGKDPYRIYIGEDAIKNMNPSFQGKPVYVDHVDGVDDQDLEIEAELAGVVVRSFFNKSDGKNWTEFVVFTDEAKKAIRQGWKLPNAYVPTSFAGGGENHGVQYLKEVVAGEYEHLAIVQNPRYEESKILTPEQFKDYNAEKESELVRLANSKETKKENSKMAKLDLKKLNIFKRAKVENGKDGLELAGLMVQLPESGEEMLLTDVILELDTIKNMNGYANGDHMVKVGEDEMSVNDLVKQHMEMCNAQAEAEEAAQNAGEGEPGEDIENDTEEQDISEGLGDVGDRGGDASLDNEEDDEEDKKKKAAAKKNSAGKPKTEAEKAAARKAALKLQNARDRGDQEQTAVVDLGSDKVARGKARYGS
jgi:hypothetical protein